MNDYVEIIVNSNVANVYNWKLRRFNIGKRVYEERRVLKYTEIFNRLTGISCPIFGVSWDPPEIQRKIAQKIIIFLLEAKRVLYSLYQYETVHPVINSVVEIKNFLTSELPNINEKSELQCYVRAMRNACNKFLSKCRDDDDFRHYAIRPGNISNCIFTSAIGEMRGVFGIMIGQIVSSYGIDIEDDLVQIIPIDNT